MLVKPMHCLNAKLPIPVMLFGIVTSPSMKQWSNTPLPILMMLSGIVTLLRLVQVANVERLMLVTLLGIVTLVKFLQLLKAASPMFVTLLGIVDAGQAAAALERIVSNALTLANRRSWSAEIAAAPTVQYAVMVIVPLFVK